MHIRTTAKQHITRETPATLQFNYSVRPWANRPVNSSRDSEYHGSGSTRMARYERCCLVLLNLQEGDRAIS